VAAIVKGMDYLTGYPANMFSFLLTVVGLFLLMVYTAYLAKKASVKGSAGASLRSVGLVITALGLYFLVVYVMFLILGAVGGWGMWYAWFTGHNLDLWLMALPFAGVALLLQEKNKHTG
jgi:hypothetical protein